MTARTTSGRARRTWWSGRGRPRHERRLRRTAIRELLAAPGGGRYGERQIEGVAATAPPLLVGGARAELRAAVGALAGAAAGATAAGAAEQAALDDLRRIEDTAPEPPADEPDPGPAGDEPDADELLAAQRSTPRRVQARTVEGIMVLFDWFFYTQTYLQVSGQPAGWADADQTLTFFGALLLGLVGPPIVLVSARIIARQLARVRDGLLGDAAAERANWIAVQAAALVLVVLTVVFYMVMRLRLQLAAGLGNDLPPNVWVLQVLVALLPVAVVLSDYWAADPRADEAATRVSLRTAARARRAAVPTRDDRMRAARDRSRAGTAAVVVAAEDHERAWLDLYDKVVAIVADAGYFGRLAGNLISDVRAFVATEQRPDPERPGVPVIGPAPAPPATPAAPAADWTALDGALVALVRYAPDGLRDVAETLRATLLPDPGPDGAGSADRDSA